MIGPYFYGNPELTVPVRRGASIWYYQPDMVPDILRFLRGVKKQWPTMTVVDRMIGYVTRGEPVDVRPLSIYLVSQYENTWPDTYQSFVVAAYNEDEARRIHPHTESTDWPVTYETGADTWLSMEDIDSVVVQRIGAVVDPDWEAGGAGTVYCRSFNEDRYEEKT